MASILSTVTASSLLISLGLCKLCSQGHSQKVKYPLPCMKSVKLQSQTHHQWDRKVYDAHKVVKKSVTLKNNITYRCIIGSCPHFADKKVGCRQEKVWRVFFFCISPNPCCHCYFSWSTEHTKGCFLIPQIIHSDAIQTHLVLFTGDWWLKLQGHGPLSILVTA